MSGKKFFYLCLAVSLALSTGFYFIRSEYQYRQHFRPASLDQCAQQADLLADYYAAWQAEDWEAMAQIPFPGQDAAFYAETLSGKSLDRYKVIGWLTDGEDYTLLQAMLTVNGTDTLARVKLVRDEGSEAWRLNSHDWDFHPFNYSSYRQRVYGMNQMGNLKDAAILFAVLFGTGSAAYLILTLMNRRKAKSA